MEELLNQIDGQFLQALLNAIEAHAQPRTYDWILLVCTIVSIALSFAAILCTIRVSKKQDDIALFEKRYAIYKKLHHTYAQIQGVAKEGNQCNTADILQALVEEGNTLLTMDDVAFQVTLIKYAERINLLFDYKLEDINEMIDVLSVMRDTLSADETPDLEKLTASVKTYQKHVQALRKQLKISKKCLLLSDIHQKISGLKKTKKAPVAKKDPRKLKL